MALWSILLVVKLKTRLPGDRISSQRETRLPNPSDRILRSDVHQNWEHPGHPPREPSSNCGRMEEALYSGGLQN